jgi:hypothetical protein
MGYVQGTLRGIWRAVSYLPPVWVLVLNSLLFVQVQPAFGHSDAIVNCDQNIKYSEAKKVDVDLVFASTGLYAEHYDTNGDGKFDVVAFSDVNLKTLEHKANPVFWMVDRNYDGTPDAVYIDVKGKGQCSDIKLYQDLNAPQSNFDTPSDMDKRRDS